MEQGYCRGHDSDAAEGTPEPLLEASTAPCMIKQLRGSRW